jgi:hypothetical protein
MRMSMKSGLIALALLPAVALGTMGTASARDGQNAAGIVGGLAAGAIVGGAIAGSQGGYDREYEPVYTRACHRERQPIYDNWGNYRGDRIVRVCE